MQFISKLCFKPLISYAFLSVGLLASARITHAASANAPTGAKPKSDTATFLHRWAASPQLERTGPNGKTAARKFTRYVWIDQDKNFDIGNITSFQFPKAGLPKDKNGRPVFDRADTAEKIRIAMGFAQWSPAPRKQKSASVYEADWVPMGRHVRIYMWETADSFSYSIAMFRLAYAESFAPESELIQRNLAGVQDVRLPELDQWIHTKGAQAWTFEFPELFASAYAAPPCPPCPPGAPPACAIAMSACTQSGALTDSINGLNTTVGGLNSTVTSATGSANQQAAAANANAANAITKLGDMTTAWNDTNKHLAGFDADWQKTNEQYKRTNDLFAKFLDPGSMFVLGAATAAGAALGALAVNIGVEGLGFIGTAISEAITHAKDNEQRLKAFQEAREIWEKASETAHMLETTIDQLLEIHQMMEGMKLTREEVISKLGISAEQASTKHALAKKRELDALERGDQACFEKYSQDAVKFEDAAALMINLRTLFQQTPDRRKGEKDPFCDGLLAKLKALRDSEELLQNARADILMGQSAFFNAENAKFKERTDGMERLLDPKDNISFYQQREQQIKQATEERDSAIKKAEAKAEKQIRSCMDDVAAGTICQRMNRDVDNDMGNQRFRMKREFEDPNTSEERKKVLIAHEDYIYRWQNWHKSQRGSCKEINTWGKATEIPLLGIFFRASTDGRKWCTTYLNGTPEFIEWTTDKTKAETAHSERLKAAEKAYSEYDTVKNQLGLETTTHTKAMIGWMDWFKLILNEQACAASELACDANTKGNEKALVNRFSRLLKKEAQIENVCRGRHF